MVPEPQSPFLPPPKRATFGVDWMLVLTAIAASAVTLFAYSLFLPSVTAEANAWLGRTVPVSAAGEDRRAHIVFLVLCYSAPMFLLVALRSGHWLVRRLSDAYVKQSRSSDDDEFRMS